VFAYSYAAADLFRYAKSRGWQTVLGQIDPGPFEEDIVKDQHTQTSGYKSDWLPAPSSYWKSWREECALADRIVVNSSWCKRALETSGVEPRKIREAPLAYESDLITVPFDRKYPSRFSRQRPLKVLFLGQVIVRKGVVPLFEAAKLLQNEPIEFWLVGPVGVRATRGALSKNVHMTGPASRNTVSKYYQMADVFLLPTFSDGFGLTQLEAQAWKLPIIASKFCGEVVRNGKTGIVLDTITPEAIAESILECMKNPGRLQEFSNRIFGASPNDLKQLHESLEGLAFERG
jgi:glycosyltransferase involved in cell wall biosynthesis